MGRRLSDRGLLAGTQGNISVRLDSERIVVTPGGVSKGRLSPRDMITVNLTTGAKLQGPGRASSELPMHLFVYRNRPDILACVHAHPPYATAFAVAGVQLAEDFLPEVVLSVGRVPLTDYAPPGTQAVPQALAPFIADCNAFLLRNHGLLTIGRTLEEAYNRHETVEHCARIAHLSSQIGDPHGIPADDYERLSKIRREGEKTQDN